MRKPMELHGFFHEEYFNDKIKRTQNVHTKNFGEVSVSSRNSYGRYLIRQRFWISGAERRPCVHQLAPLFEEIAAPIGGLDSIGNSVRERLLGNLAWE